MELAAMRAPVATAVVFAALGVVVGCGDDAADAPVALSASGATYRALSESERLSVAAACRDRAADAAQGIAAEQLQKIDPQALRARLDLALRRGRRTRAVPWPSSARTACRS